MAHYFLCILLYCQNLSCLQMQCMKEDKDISGLQIRVCIWKITVLISQPKHTLWILKRIRSLEYPKQMFKRMDKKLLTILHPKVVFIWRPEISTKRQLDI